MTTPQAVLAFYVAFMGVAMVWPTLRVWRSTGVNPVVLPRDDSVEGFVGRAFKLLVGALGLYLAGLATGLFGPVGPITSTASTLCEKVGWLLVGVSLAWVVIAQFQMGRSWRVGIDRANVTPLVRHGLFRFSRNPIFVGMMVQLAGLLLVLPDAVVLTVFVAAFVLISVQIRLEEAYLRACHPSAYDKYAASVRRWL